ncbi:MAG TPA: secondary thiamine-phosphate synthase enzyme YjbQ [Nitrospiria bacterium]|nr:secondary thiamine-phosphate synthase enzyme YjbQ [Nitrospiria bacterium]
MIEQRVVKTRESAEIIDVTAEIQAAVDRCGVKDGICVVYVPHTTVGLLINEAEPGFHSDLLRVLDRLVPEKGAYRHPDGNSHAHIKASLIGSEKQFIVRDGRIALGTWQAIFLCEFDGPRSRQVLVKVLEG